MISVSRLFLKKTCKLLNVWNQILLHAHSNFENHLEIEQVCTYNRFHISSIFQCCTLSIKSPLFVASLFLSELECTNQDIGSNNFPLKMFYILMSNCGENFDVCGNGNELFERWDRASFRRCPKIYGSASVIPFAVVDEWSCLIELSVKFPCFLSQGQKDHQLGLDNRL